MAQEGDDDLLFMDDDWEYDLADGFEEFDDDFRIVIWFPFKFLLPPFFMYLVCSQVYCYFKLNFM